VSSSRPALRLVRSTPVAEPEAAVDPADLDAVFRRYASYVARIAARLLGQADEIDDLVQDVFLDAIRGLRSLREASAIRGWLATVTVRHARRRLRRRTLWAMLGLDRPVELDQLVGEATSAEARAEVIAVYRALDRLPVDARIAWVLHAVEGHALEEVAAMGGYSRATAHRRIQLAQQAVEAALRGA
jgi:RNA polymerase sigma-70 factor (ECF subfamily)